jgi:hypothetical protein
MIAWIVMAAIGIAVLAFIIWQAVSIAKIRLPGETYLEIDTIRNSRPADDDPSNAADSLRTK